MRICLRVCAGVYRRHARKTQHHQQHFSGSRLVLLVTVTSVILYWATPNAKGCRRAIDGSHPEYEEPYVEPRDTREWSDEDRSRLE